MRFLAGLVLLVGCEGGGQGDEILMAEGAITSDGSTAEVAARKAFGFATSGQGFVYVASNGDATCGAVVDYLTSTDPYDPTDILVAGHCNLSLDFDYDGGWDGHEVLPSDITTGLWSVSCAMDDGSWSLEERKGFVDYFYSGRWWQGSPLDHHTVLSGDGEELVVDLEMSEYDGDYIYEDLESHPGSGRVTGTIDATWCAQLAQTPFFHL